MEQQVKLPHDYALHSITQVLETPRSRETNTKHDIPSCVPRGAQEHTVQWQSWGKKKKKRRESTAQKY